MVDRVFYEVPNMQLIKQDKSMACWYASAMMVLNWNGGRPICSAIDQKTIDIYKANTGIQNAQIIPLAKRLGLVPVPPMSPTIEALAGWLHQYGPLWTNGKQHIVVIAGIKGDQRSGYEVKVYDPWPGIGISWRTLAGWYTGFNPGGRPESSRDTGKDVQAVFLHAH